MLENNKIFCIIIYGKKSGTLILSDKAFNTLPSAHKFLIEKGFMPDKEDIMLFASEHFICRIKKVDVKE